MSGAFAPATVHPAASAAQFVGGWEAPFEGQVPAVNLVLLGDGRVLYWSGVEANEADTDPTHAVFITSSPNHAESRVLDLSTNPPTILAPSHASGAGGDLFCSGNVLLADGRVLVAGATHWHTLPDPQVPLTGGRDAQVFDPSINDWLRVADMHVGRWYPTLVKLPDGDALVASGIGTLIDPATQQTLVERYDVSDDAWTNETDRLLPLYPRLSIVPGGPLKGQLFYNTVATLHGPFGEHPLEAVWSIQQAFDPEEGAWRLLGPSVYGARQHGVNVMLPLRASNDYTPRYLSFGGTLQRSVVAVPLSEIADLATDPPTNTMAASLHHARWHANGVLLPDGTVLAVGGGQLDNVVLHGVPNLPVLEAELYDPSRDTWTDVAPMTVPRMYHSTALLLPDGRVLVGGHVPLPNPFKVVRDTVNPQIRETRLEIYDPPYLFRGPRPAIVSAPATVAYNATFEIQIDAPAGIHSVALVHPGATTHAYDMTQRLIELDLEHIGDTKVLARAPPDAVVAPPGAYMLFVNGLHADGPVPSTARFIALG